MAIRTSFQPHPVASRKAAAQTTTSGIFVVCFLIGESTRVLAAEGYTTNPFCRQHRCINPAFPGLDELPHLEANRWQCQSSDSVNSYLKFCKGAVNYDVAIPSPAVGNATTLDVIVDHQDNAASAMYFYHLNAMNIEPWNHRKPQMGSDECVRSVWRMVCNTYFPRPEAGCTQGQPTPYLRPCKNVCQQYVHQCGVECCDGSLQCVFNHRETFGENPAFANVFRLETGYYDEVGPHHLCTGHASRSSSPPSILLVLGLLFFLTGRATPASPRRRTPEFGLPVCLPVKRGVFGLLLAAPLLLTGCDVLERGPAASLSKPSYLVSYHYIPPGKSWKESTLNSCEIIGLPAQQQCSGNGFCKEFRPDADGLPSDIALRFCECDRDWADPECRTRRKSQKKAYVLALFGGFLGLDQFYVGEYPAGVAKLTTLGGVGIWWALDVVRIGSAPIYSAQFRLAADLDHGFFVVSSLAFFALIGYVLFDKVANRFQRKRERAAFFVSEEAEFHRTRSATLQCQPQGASDMPKVKFGTPLPIKGYGAVTHSVILGAERNDLAAYYVFLEDQRSKEESKRKAAAAAAEAEAAADAASKSSGQSTGDSDARHRHQNANGDVDSCLPDYADSDLGPERSIFRPAVGTGWSPYGDRDASAIFDIYEPQ